MPTTARDKISAVAERNGWKPAPHDDELPKDPALIEYRRPYAAGHRTESLRVWFAVTGYVTRACWAPVLSRHNQVESPSLGKADWVLSYLTRPPFQ